MRRNITPLDGALGLTAILRVSRRVWQAGRADAGLRLKEEVFAAGLTIEGAGDSRLSPLRLRGISGRWTLRSASRLPVPGPSPVLAGAVASARFRASLAATVTAGIVWRTRLLPPVKVTFEARDELLDLTILRQQACGGFKLLANLFLTQ